MSRSGFGQIIWPDGKSLLEQPMKLISAFNIIAKGEEMNKPKKQAG